MSTDEQDAMREEREKIAEWIDREAKEMSGPTALRSNDEGFLRADELERVAREIRDGAHREES